MIWVLGKYINPHPYFNAMASVIATTIIVLYATVGVVSFLAYWPTVRHLLDGRLSANTTSYLIWTVTSLITLLYSLFVLQDLLFRIMSGLAFLACLSIWVLCMRLEYRLDKKRNDRKKRHR